MVASLRTRSNSCVDSPRSVCVMSPSMMLKRSDSAPVSSAMRAVSARARSMKAGCTSSRKRAPSSAKRLTSRPAMKPGNPVRKIVSSTDKCFLLREVYAKLAELSLKALGRVERVKQRAVRSLIRDETPFVERRDDNRIPRRAHFVNAALACAAGQILKAQFPRGWLREDISTGTMWNRPPRKPLVQLRVSHLQGFGPSPQTSSTRVRTPTPVEPLGACG